MLNVTLLNEHGIPPNAVQKELNTAYERDYHFKDGRVLYSMCNSPPEIAKKAHIKFIEANLSDAKIYEGTSHLEKCVISMVGSILHYKNESSGHITSGGTEANITSLWISRNITHKREVILPVNSHYSVVTACDILGLKPVYANLNSQYQIDYTEVERKINKNTCCVVANAGNTELGIIDPVKELSAICIENKILLHVDACYGGFIFPFMEKIGYNIPTFDFRLDGVTTISCDPHKFGRSTMGAGGILVRNEKMYDVIKIPSPYLSLREQTSVTGGRCSASVAAAYASMRKFGWEGYIKMVKLCLRKTEYVCKRISELDLELAVKPPATVIGIKFRAGVREKIIVDLQKNNWIVSKGEHPQTIRIVIMPHLSWKHLESFLADFENILKKRKLL